MAIITLNNNSLSNISSLPAGVGGKVLQVVTNSTTTTVSNTSTSLVDTTLTATITPSSTSNKILVLICQSVHRYNTGSYASVLWSLFRNSTVIYEGANDNNGAILSYDYGGSGLNVFHPTPLTILDSPASVSAQTYKTQIARGNNGGTARAQPESNKSTITLMEIQG